MNWYSKKITNPIFLVILVVLMFCTHGHAQQIFQYNNKYNAALLQTLKRDSSFSPSQNSQSKWILLNYADPKAVADNLKVHFPSALISTDLRLRAVCITADPLVIKNTEKLIQKWDKPVAQIKYEVKIVEVNSVFLEANQAAFSELVNMVQLRFDHDENKIVGPAGLQALLSFLMQSGQARLMAKPTILTLDGNRAAIKIGDKIPFITQTVHENFITEEMHQVDSGLELEILPKVISENQVLTEVVASLSGIKLWRQLGSGEYPVIALRKTDTKVYLKPGETLVIAGLYDESEKSIQTGVPYLKDIPLIGGWFSGIKKEVVHNDILFFITPSWALK